MVPREEAPMAERTKREIKRSGEGKGGRGYRKGEGEANQREKRNRRPSIVIFRTCIRIRALHKKIFAITRKKYLQ